MLVNDVISGCDDVTVRPADSGQQCTHRERERDYQMLLLQFYCQVRREEQTTKCWSMIV